MFTQLKSLLTLLLIIFTVANLYTQTGKIIQGSPEWLVEMYFNKPLFTGKANYYTGGMIEEAEEPTIGEELNGSANISYRKIASENSKDVYAIEIEHNEAVVDFYCYLVETDDSWKIEAVRRFLLPGFIYSAKDSLSQIENISSSDANLFNLVNLLTSSDEQLKQYLSDNVSDFYKLILYIDDEDEKNIQKLLNELNLDAVYMDDNFPGCIFLQIGAFENKETGYFYSGESSSLPQISPNQFIYIEEILPKWYLYRII